MIKFVKDLLTETDNETFCLARVALILSLFTFIGFSGYEVYNSKGFKASDFASGVMQILTGGAAIIGAKTFTTKDFKKD